MMSWVVVLLEQADVYPEKLEELRETFYLEAAKYNVFPIDNNRWTRFDISGKPSLVADRTELRYYEGALS